MEDKLTRLRKIQGKTAKRKFISTWLRTEKQEQIKKNNILFREARRLKRIEEKKKEVE